VHNFLRPLSPPSLSCAVDEVEVVVSLRSEGFPPSLLVVPDTFPAAKQAAFPHSFPREALSISV